MRRLAVVLSVAAAVTVPMVSAAAADPLEPLRVIDVFVTGDGDVCVTYDDLSTVCTNT